MPRSGKRAWVRSATGRRKNRRVGSECGPRRPPRDILLDRALAVNRKASLSGVRDQAQGRASGDSFRWWPGSDPRNETKRVRSPLWPKALSRDLERKLARQCANCRCQPSRPRRCRQAGRSHGSIKVRTAPAGWRRQQTAVAILNADRAAIGMDDRGKGPSAARCARQAWRTSRRASSAAGQRGLEHIGNIRARQAIAAAELVGKLRPLPPSERTMPRDDALPRPPGPPREHE